jgi:hypothetical protein
MARYVHDYFAVAVATACRFHHPLLVRFHDDVIQECHLLAWEAQVRRSVTVKNGSKTKRYGNCRRVGLKAFTRACNARFSVFRKQYFSY